MSRGLLLLSLLAPAFASFAAPPRPARTYDLLDVSWRLRFDIPNSKIFGDVTNTLRPLKDGTVQIGFDCADLTVEKVLVNGALAKFALKDHWLSVDLPKAAGSKDTIKARIIYSGRPEAGCYFVRDERAAPSKTGMIYTQGEMEDTRYWVPTWDYPNDRATSESFIEVPANYNVLSNGVLKSVTSNGKNKIYHWKLDQPVVTYLLSFIAGVYVEKKEEWDGIPISYFVPPGLEKQGAASFAGTNKMVQFFSELTGLRYPYGKFAQGVVSDFMFGGMENTTAVTQTIDTLHLPEEQPIYSSEGLVLHELAHQWFGDTTTCDDWSHIWLNEGFATFLPSFYVRKFRGQDAYDISRFDTFEGGLGGMDASKRPMVYTGYNEPIEMFDGNAYPGGASRMFVLMDLLGEEQFWKSIKVFLNDFKFKTLTTEQFFESFSKSSGMDLSQFMKQWFYTAVSPKITAQVNGDMLSLSLNSPEFVLSVPVWFLKGDRWIIRKADFRSGTASVPLTDVEGLPFLVDPKASLMCRVDYGAAMDQNKFLAVYSQAPNAGQRARLIAYSLDAASCSAIGASESNPELLARLIGKMDAAKVEQLIGFTGHSDARVRNASFARLGASGANPAAIAALKSGYESDPNPAVRLTAVTSLMNVTADEALAEQVWNIASTNEGFRRAALNWRVANRPDEARERCLAQLAKPINEPVRTMAIEHLGTLKDKPGEDRVFRALSKVAMENSVGARMAAIRSLGAMKSPGARLILEPITRHGLHFMRNAAKDAIKALN